MKVYNPPFCRTLPIIFSNNFNNDLLDGNVALTYCWFKNENKYNQNVGVTLRQCYFTISVVVVVVNHHKFPQLLIFSFTLSYAYSCGFGWWWWHNMIGLLNLNLSLFWVSNLKKKLKWLLFLILAFNL